jgi:hypothetical protein
MTLEGPTQTALVEFAIIAKHIGTRDLVQEFLAFKIFPTMKEWAMPKLKGEKKEGNLSDCPTTTSSRNISKHPAKNGWKQSK